MTPEFFRKKLKKPLIHSEALNAMNSVGRDFFITSAMLELTAEVDSLEKAWRCLPVE